MSQEHLAWVAHQSPISAIRFTPDGGRMITAGHDTQVRVWDPHDDFAEVAVLDAHEKPITDLAMSPDGREFATASVDRTVRRWSCRDLSLLGTLTGHKGAVTCVRYAPDGRSLATAGQDLTIRVWDRESGACTTTLKGLERHPLSLAWLADGGGVVASGLGEELHHWTLSDASHRSVPTGHKASVVLGGLIADSELLLSAGYEGQIRLWSTRTWEPRKGFEPGVAGQIFLDLAPHGGMLALGSERSVSLWSLENLESLIELPIKPKGVTAVAFSPDGAWLVAASSDKRLRVWEVDTII